MYAFVCHIIIVFITCAIFLSKYKFCKSGGLIAFVFTQLFHARDIFTRVEIRLDKSPRRRG